MTYDDFWTAAYLAAVHSGRPVSEALKMADAGLRGFKKRVAAKDFTDSE